MLYPSDEGKGGNSYLVHIGLANTDQPGLYPFAYGLNHAKRNHLGIWK